MIDDGVIQKCSIGEQQASFMAKQKRDKSKFPKHARMGSNSLESFHCKPENISQKEMRGERTTTVDSADAEDKKSNDKLKVSSNQSAMIVLPNKKRKFAVVTDEQLCKKVKPDSKLDSASNTSSSHKRRIDVGRLKNFLKNSKTVDLPSNDHQFSDCVNKSARQGGNKQVTARSLNDRMLSRLTEARFRYINEQMYNCTGGEAAEIFKKDKEAFRVYHSGFQLQVDKWPVNPVDNIIEYIHNR